MIPVLAQDEGGVEVSEDPPEKTLEERIHHSLLVLRDEQDKDGSWHHRQLHTGLVLYTLATCGAERKDAAIASGLAWIHKDAKERRTTKEYEGATGPACVILALAALNRPANAKPAVMSENPTQPPRGSRFDKDDWRLMNEYAALLTTTTARGSARARMTRPSLQDERGGWGQGSTITTTHLVLTALREAMLAGYPVAPDSLSRALGCVREWRARSGIKGAYSVLPGEEAKGMVCAWICREGLAQRADPKNPVPEWSRALTEGLPHVGTLLLDVQGTRRAIGCDALWAVEQLGSLTSTAEIDGVKWREGGTRYLLGHEWGEPDEDETLDACFALLFLKERTPPLAAGK